MPDRTSALDRPGARARPYDPAVRLRLAACIAALAVGVAGLVTASVRVGRLLLIARGEQLLVPASAALVALGVGGIVLLLAARRRRTAVAALGIGVAGLVVGVVVRALSTGPFAQTGSGPVPYRPMGSVFAWSLSWSLVFGPALTCLSAALVLLALVSLVATSLRRTRSAH
jgi:hypothetical protein